MCDGKSTEGLEVVALCGELCREGRITGNTGKSGNGINTLNIRLDQIIYE